jgi:hypothetical protein
VTTVQKTPAVQTFRNDQRYLQTSDVARRAYSPAKGPSSVAHVSPDNVDFNRYEQEEIALSDFSTGEVNATTHLFSDGTAFRATTTTSRSDTPFAAVRSRIEPWFFRIGDRRAPIVATVQEDKADAPGAMSAPPTLLQSDTAEPGTVLSATTGQLQRGHNEQQGDTSAPLYHNEGAINMASMLCAMTMPRISFTEVLPQEYADDMLFSPLTRRQGGFDARSTLCSAGEHLQTRVRTIFESPPSLGFLTLAWLSSTSSLPPRTVCSTGVGSSRVPSSSATPVPMSDPPLVAPLCDSVLLLGEVNATLDTMPRLPVPPCPNTTESMAALPTPPWRLQQECTGLHYEVSMPIYRIGRNLAMASTLRTTTMPRISFPTAF